ncbi:uncharacterized protein LOC106159403 [Lingula anatina]|uniref:Uncharacterized protein LOC106159403 n=1 Tax=Lingula anatina TaxID=7574 RepID=A0A1S3HYN8_LINAN|nr:uncharacterized protein LOC106159403 [Lingula anatina]|eukprot:XP_013391137.1 uncharacterized protein LOC106159403 [Lingula anatina]
MIVQKRDTVPHSEESLPTDMLAEVSNRLPVNCLSQDLSDQLSQCNSPCCNGQPAPCPSPCCNGQPAPCPSPCCNGQPAPCPSPCCNGKPPPCPSPCCNGLFMCQSPCCQNPPPQQSTPMKCNNLSDCLDFSDLSFHPDHDSTYIQDTDSESEWESPDEEAEKDDTDPVTDTKCLVFHNQLKGLFEKCLGDKFCAAPVVDRKEEWCGSMLTVKGTCLNHHDFVWRSQPVVNKQPVGNILCAGAILFTGNTFTSFKEITEALNLKTIQERQFYAIQKKHLLPCVNQMWKIHQEQLLSEYTQDEALVVAGDGRCDSPGHTATFGTYSLMDTKTNRILTTNVVKVTEVPNSYHMENEGLVRCMQDLHNSGVTVHTIATDRHPQITKTLREKYPSVEQQYDVWHLDKSVKKKLSAVVKKKECADLQPWAKAISHHLWWSADSCQGNALELKERWQSILRHTVNIHEWTVGQRFLKCAHEDLSDKQSRSKKWLKAGSPAHKALQSIVLDKRLTKDLESVTGFCHTGHLEVYHNMLLKYAPKRLSFSYEGTVARTLLAVLDNNHNQNREQVVNKNGTLRWNVRWSKVTKRFTAQKVMGQKDMEFRQHLMQCAVDRVERGLGEEIDKIFVPELARNTVAKTPKPTRDEVVQGHISRFRKLTY